MELISVKALSEELGVSKPTLFKRIDKLGLRSELQKQGKALMIPYEVAEKLREAYKVAEREPEKAEEQNSTKESEDITSALIEMLKEELKNKEEHIKYLENQVSELQADVRRYTYQNQLLLSSGSGAEESQSEPVEAEFTEEPEAERTEEEPKSEHKKSFLRRLFNM